MVAWWRAVLLPATSTASNLAPLRSKYSQAAMDPLATASISGLRPSAGKGAEFTVALRTIREIVNGLYGIANGIVTRPLFVSRTFRRSMLGRHTGRQGRHSNKGIDVTAEADLCAKARHMTLKFRCLAARKRRRLGERAVSSSRTSSRRGSPEAVDDKEGEEEEAPRDSVSGLKEIKRTF